MIELQKGGGEWTPQTIVTSDTIRFSKQKASLYYSSIFCLFCDAAYNSIRSTIQKWGRPRPYWLGEEGQSSPKLFWPFLTSGKCEMSEKQKQLCNLYVTATLMMLWFWNKKYREESFNFLWQGYCRRMKLGSFPSFDWSSPRLPISIKVHLCTVGLSVSEASVSTRIIKLNRLARWLIRLIIPVLNWMGHEKQKQNQNQNQKQCRALVFSMFKV